jgi:hypothetical protein
MSGWFRQIALMAKVRTGASGAFFVWLAVAVFALVAAAVSFWLAAFVWLSDRFGGVEAGLILGGVLVAIALVAALIAQLLRRRSVARAKRELEERRRASLMDPGLIPIALQIGQTLGWRRLAALAAVGLFAAGFAREWLGDRKDKSGDDAKD